ncbi:predicted protein [Sclerotinia sclerotiorum 1980 UF-70]|uniref:Uncharacterized protein n=1 Tax=Sclerotinia sclerotiorum (strain ATCC 18683 / 1980 / Ss-1) TaxID=665079 RepID=A7EAY9_SCLS1|nr:predicted protein [Sclerotinia sclerotiorum 1980 UF-70]EDN99617.1 predicted protein [Sclerotinia sclerotiorum 1980 UF-70]
MGFGRIEKLTEIVLGLEKLLKKVSNEMRSFAIAIRK